MKIFSTLAKSLSKLFTKAPKAVQKTTSNPLGKNSLFDAINDFTKEMPATTYDNVSDLMKVLKG